MPSATATTPAVVPPAIAPTFVLDEPDLLGGLEPLSLLLALVGVFSVIIIRRSGSLQPLIGAFLVEPPFLLLADQCTFLPNHFLSFGEFNLLATDKPNNLGGDFVCSLIRCKLVGPC